MKQKQNVGVVLVALGILLLVEKERLLTIGWVGFWPLFILGPGLLLLLEYFSGVREEGSLSHKKELVVPGVFLTGVGICLFPFSLEYQNWKVLSSLWPIFLILLGLGFFLDFLTDRTDQGLLIPASAFVIVGAIGLEVLYLKKRFGPVFFLGVLGIVLPPVIRYHLARVRARGVAGANLRSRELRAKEKGLNDHRQKMTKDK